MKNRTTKILEKLQKVSCRGLLGIARRAIKTKAKSVSIPGVRAPVSLRIVAYTGDGEKAHNGWFLPGKILIATGGDKKPVWTLVHEMRHAQQHALLGARTFYHRSKADRNELVHPLELDARAAEIASGGTPYKELKKYIPEVVEVLEFLSKKQAKKIK